MTREWKPGDVAEIPFGRGDVRCIYTPEGWVQSDNNEYPAVKGYSDVRPLVVIDPEDREQVERLWRMAASRLDVFADCLRMVANPKPPKPEEPTGLGAVVEDVDGQHWVRFKAMDDETWVGDQSNRAYDDIDAVRVLSEGVQP